VTSALVMLGQESKRGKGLAGALAGTNPVKTDARDYVVAALFLQHFLLHHLSRDVLKRMDCCTASSLSGDGDEDCVVLLSR